MQKKLATSPRGYWIWSGGEAEEVRRVWKPQRGRPAAGGLAGYSAWDLWREWAATELQRKLAKPGRGLTSAADHDEVVRLTQPPSPARTALWGSWGNTQACEGLHRPGARDSGRPGPRTLGLPPRSQLRRRKRTIPRSPAAAEQGSPSPAPDASEGRGAARHVTGSDLAAGAMGALDPEVAPWARGGAAGMAGAGAGAGARGGAAAGVEARARDPPPAHRAHPRHPRPAAQPSARRMDGASGGLGSGDNAPTTEALFVALGAGVTALSHPLLYVKLLIQVGGRGHHREVAARGGDRPRFGLIGSEESMTTDLGEGQKQRFLWADEIGEEQSREDFGDAGGLGLEVLETGRGFEATHLRGWKEQGIWRCKERAMG